jgi:ABC-2 type transport system permease protein
VTGRHAFWICAKDVRHRLRDRTALLVGLVAPLALSGILGGALGRIESGLSVRFAFVDLDRSARSQAVAASIREEWPARSVTLEDVATEEAAEALVASGAAQAALVVPAGFAGALAAGAPVALDVRTSGRDPLAAHLARSLAARFAAREEAGSRGVSLERVSLDRRLRPIDHYGPSLAVLFLFFSVLGGMRAFQREADGGTLARLAAAPVGHGEVLAGKFGALVGLGLVQFAVLALAGAALFDVRWGLLLPVSVLAAGTVLAAVGLMAFLMSAAGQSDHGWVYGSVAVFVLSLLGGQFLPPEGLPDSFDTLVRLTPNGQAVRGFTDLAAAGPEGSLALVIEPLLVTFGVGALGILYCARRLRRPQAPRG